MGWNRDRCLDRFQYDIITSTGGVDHYLEKILIPREYLPHFPSSAEIKKHRLVEWLFRVVSPYIYTSDAISFQKDYPILEFRYRQFFQTQCRGGLSWWGLHADERDAIPFKPSHLGKSDTTGSPRGFASFEQRDRSIHR